jgi:hypothetical protein
MPSSGRVEDRSCAWARPLSTELLGPFMVRIIWDNHFLPMQRIAATSHKHSTRRPSIPPPSRRAVRRCHPGRQKSGLHTASRCAWRPRRPRILKWRQDVTGSWRASPGQQG